MVAITRRRLLYLRKVAKELEPWDGKFPDGRKPGIRRETLAKISDRCPSIITAVNVIPERHWDELCKSTAHLEKRLWVPYTLDQNGVGSCASESGTIKYASMLVNDEGVSPDDVPVFNPWSIYWNTSGGRDQGSVIGDNVEYLRDYGVCPEEVHPRSLGWRKEPSEAAKRIAKLFRILSFFYIKNQAELVSTLLQGFCVHGGYSGHAVDFVMYLGKGLLLFKNSWGDWGDNGFGTLRLDQVYFPYGAYAYMNVLPWNRQDWLPSMNQPLLAKAVRQYVAECGKTFDIWSQRKDSQRKLEYERVLASCGLSS